MIKKHFRNLSALLAFLLGALIFGIQFAFSFTEPSSAPPQNNVPAPLNTSAVGQIKSGNLTVNGLGISGTGNALLVTDGNVGIGTVDPTSVLHISRDFGGIDWLNLTGNFTGGNTFAINPFISGVSNSGFEIRDVTNNAQRFVITNSGNVGIGRTNPDLKLHVQNNNDSVKIQSNDSSSLYEGIVFYESGGARNAGIRAHNSNPANGSSVNALEIWGESGPVIFSGGRNVEFSGQVKISGGTPGAGKVLTSIDGSGLANWQTLTGGGAPSGPAGGDLADAYPNPTIAANAVALTTDTTGNYMAGLTAGTGISISGTAGEGWNPTVSVSSGGISTTEITNNTIVFADWASNGCTLNQIPKWNGTDWTCQNDASGSSYWSLTGSDIYNQNLANVGIGTGGAASSKLHVKNTTSDEILRLTSGNKDAIFRVGSGDGNLVINVNGQDVLVSGATMGMRTNPTTATLSIASAGGDALYVTSGNSTFETLNITKKTRMNTSASPDLYGLLVENGNVGIGVLTPSKKLEVSGGIAIDTNTLYVDEVNNRVGIGISSPAGKLDVRGDIKLGSSGGLFAAGGSEKIQITRGKVYSNGAKQNGNGFTVSRISTGKYRVIYSPIFGDIPAVAVTTQGPNTTCLANISSIASQTDVETKCSSAGWGLVDVPWDFVAAGASPQ